MTGIIPNEEVREEFIRAVTAGKHTEIARLIRYATAGNSSVSAPRDIVWLPADHCDKLIPQ